ncbi:MAG: phospholipid carrier-dependent glycosyltransferase [Synechococcales cyanobacterium T60_A2020_003]|nr:phospholipid carrier-dependent glycosyltransferase [Synechococcales cyanobacterium T60_A2020_003]
MNLDMNRNKNIALLSIILLVSIILNLYSINFPFGYHPDEVIKVHFIQNNTQDFSHPILILQIVRIFNSVLRFQSEQSIVTLGRTTTAILGTLSVFLIYTLARRTLPTPYALGAALLTAVAPGLVVHSHYLKEDVAFTFSVLLSFICFFHFIDAFLDTQSSLNPSLLFSKPNHDLMWRPVILLGLATGLMLSAKYKAPIIIFVYLISPLYVFQLRKLSYFKNVSLALIISIVVFLLINFPILISTNTFINGFNYEFKHAITGHIGISINPLEHLFLFHARYSIIPSLTALPFLCALLFMAYSMWQWRETSWQDLFLIVYVGIYYLTIELSPLKPWPDFMRYIVPLIPILAYMGMQLVHLIANYVPLEVRSFSALALTTILVLFPFIDSVKLSYYLNRDTRDQVNEIMLSKAEPIVYEAYVKPFVYPPEYPRLTEFNPQEVCTMIASSFMYERYLLAGTLSNQAPDVYEKNQQYLKLFQYPYTEISPKHRSFAFSNPTLRVIDTCYKSEP